MASAQDLVNTPSAHACEYGSSPASPKTPTWDDPPLPPLTANQPGVVPPAVALPSQQQQQQAAVASHQVKLVLVGDSGVGKTALRQRYLGQAFHDGYKATIGCDYVVKALELGRAADPATAAAASGPANPADVGCPSPPSTTISVRLAVWDTAGQERYASLSTAFFRGADAVVFVYDGRSRRSLRALERWWIVFSERCPVRPGEERSFPVAVVGNKADLVHSTNGASLEDDEDGAVSEADARAFWETLLPPAIAEARPPPAPLGPSTDPSVSSTGSSTDRPASPTSPPPTTSISVSSAPPPVKPQIGANGTILAGAHHAHEAAYQAPTEAFASAVRTALGERPPIGPPPPSTKASEGLAPLPSTVARGGFHLPPAASSASLASFKTARSSLTVVGSSSGSGLPSSLPRATFPIDEDSHDHGPGSASSSGWSSNDGFDAGDADVSRSGRRPAHERSNSTASTASRLSVVSATSAETGSSETTVRPPPARDLQGSRSGKSLARASEEAATPPVATHPFVSAPDGPAFFPSVSAKTGDGVSAVFEHLARAVYELREREAAAEEGQASALAAAAAAAGRKVDVGEEGAKGRLRRACGC